MKIKIKMKTGRSIALFLLFFCSCTKNNKAEYSNMSRVETAYQENFDFLKNDLNKKGILMENIEIYIRAFKHEKILEVWAKNKSDGIFKKVMEFNFCASSGRLGPKRREGDRQIPEGFYHIDRFNPKSNFYLSLGVNYPNASDLVLSNKEKPGSDIFIHGGCATVGCIPLTDEKIKSLYVLASEAKKYGQDKIPVHVFPFKMTDGNFGGYGAEYPQHKAFWQQIQPGFLKFEKNKALPVFSISGNGHYHFD